MRLSNAKQCFSIRESDLMAVRRKLNRSLVAGDSVDIIDQLLKNKAFSEVVICPLVYLFEYLLVFRFNLVWLRVDSW